MQVLFQYLHSIAIIEMPKQKRNRAQGREEPSFLRALPKDLTNFGRYISDPHRHQNIPILVLRIRILRPHLSGRLRVFELQSYFALVAQRL